jgi:hypothetical protein
MKLNDMRVNSTAIQSGRWVSIGKFFPGVAVKVRGFKNKDYQRELLRKMSDIPMTERIKMASDPDFSDKLDIDLMSSCILLDWRGLEDDNGPLAFSQEKAFEILSNPDFVEFREAIDFAAKIVGKDNLVEAEATSKN